MRWTASRWCRGLVGTLVLNLVLQGIWGAALGVVQAFPYRAGPPDSALARLMAYQPPGLLDLLVPPARAQQTGPWRLSTPEADLNDPFLIEQAAALGNDPATIFAFVRDQIAFESYDGSLRGARGALWSRAGNGLDRASLLVGLLRISGFDARYVSGTLPVPDAQRLIASMFPNPTVILGCPPEDAERADPVNDPDLIAEASRHYWVEYGPAFTPLDPAFPESQPGDTFAAAVERFAEVPDVLRHKVTLRLKAELRSQLSSMMSYGGAFPIEPKTVLDHTFTAVELVGKPVSIGHFVDTWTPSSLVFSVTRHTYSPYLLIGQNDTDLSDDPIIRGTDYFEQVTNFPMGSQSLTGLKLEMDVVAPGGASETHERWLLDKVGYDVRANGGRAEIVGTSTGPSISKHQITTLYASGSRINQRAIEAQSALAEKLQHDWAEVTESVGLIDPDRLSSQDMRILKLGEDLWRKLITAATWSSSLNFALQSDSIQSGTAHTFGVYSYYASPRLVIVEGKAEVSESGKPPSVSFSIDLRKNNIRSTLYPGQSDAASIAYNIVRGITENVAEHETLSNLRAIDDKGSFEFYSTVQVFDNAASQGVEIEVVTNENREVVPSFDIGSESRARIAAAVASGRIVFTPVSSVEVDGRMRVAWYEIEPGTGEVTDVTEDGGHSALLSYAMIGLNSPASEIGAFASGTLSGNLTLVGSLLSGAAEGIKCKVFDQDECQKKMKEKTLKKLKELTEKTVKKAFATFKKADERAIFLSTFAFYVSPAGAIWFAKDPQVPFYLVNQQAADTEMPGSVLDKPGISIGISGDNVFYVEWQESPYPFAFRTQVKNLGPATDIFTLALGDIPAGFTARTSVPSITLESGQTGEVGVCLQPIDAVPPVGTDLAFEVTATSHNDPSVSLTTTGGITVPAVEGLTMAFAPPLVATEPGVPVQTTLTLRSVGSGPIADAEITVAPSAGLTVSGIVSPVSLAVGETLTWPVTLTPAADSPVNQSLSALVTARFGADLAGDPLEVNAAVGVEVGSATVVTIDRQAVIAAEADNPQLARMLAELADAVAALEQHPDDPRHLTRAEHYLRQLLILVPVNPQLAGLVDRLTPLRDLATAGDTAALLAGIGTLFSQHDLATPPPPAPRLAFAPASLESAPTLGGTLTLRLENPGNDPVTLVLSLDPVPEGVTASLSETRVTLAPREVRDAGSAAPVTLAVAQGFDSLRVFDLSVRASVEEQPDTALVATALVAVRPALADVVGVAVTPAAVPAGVTAIAATATVLNTANAPREVMARLNILTGSGDLVRTLPEVPLSLAPATGTIAAPLGTVPVDGLADGAYALQVALASPDGTALPGRTARAPFYIGQPVAAGIAAAPLLVPPGNALVDTRIDVRNLAALSGRPDAMARMIEYHTPNAIVWEQSQLGNAVGDPNTVLGLPAAESPAFLSLNGGVLTLDLGEGPNLAFDGPGDDLEILEDGNNERYDLALSEDGVNYVEIGRLQGNRRVNLGAFGLAQVRYVRITDRGTLSGATPGADIIGVRVLNPVGGVRVERALFHLGTEGVSQLNFSDTGIISTPVVANIDEDPTPEILISTNRYATAPADRFFAVDGLTGAIQWEVQGIENYQPAAAVAELRPDSAGPEIVLSAGGRLKVLSADGALLWDVSGGRVSPVVANIDADPEPEIVARAGTTYLGAFDANGQQRWRSSIRVDQDHPSAIIAVDLDGDGVAEVVTNATSANRTVALKSPATSGATADAITHWSYALAGSPFGGPAVADIDGPLGHDTGPEIIVADDSGLLHVIRADGTPLVRVQMSGQRWSPPSIADINADGLPDIVVTGDNPDRIYALTITEAVLGRTDPVPLEDVLLWSVPADDSTSSGSGISVYDLDGDGIWEVIWNGFGAGSTGGTGGGLSIISGLDGRLLYRNTRINSRTWDENVTIADIDGDGHAELLAGDQEGLWIIGADDLWIGARDIWNQQSYHITNINSDLTVPAHEPPSWREHNTWRTQRPPVGIANRIDIDIAHQLTGDYTVEPDAIAPAPTTQAGDRYTWTTARFFNDPADFTVRLRGVVPGLQPGESREIGTGTLVTAAYLDDQGQRVEMTLPLPPVVVTAAQWLDLRPPVRQTTAGEQSEFLLAIENPSSAEQAIALEVIGLDGLLVELDAQALVPAGARVELPLRIRVPETAAGERSFAVVGRNAALGTSRVIGRLGIAPILTNPVEPPAEVALGVHAVAVEVEPAAVVAGQGTTVSYRLRVTNAGADTDSYTLAVAVPSGIAATLGAESVTVPPGSTNGRYVQLLLTPTPGTAPGPVPFTVTATLAADPTIQARDTGTLTVSPLGVQAALTPAVAVPGEPLRLSVTNTGSVTETFDLTLAGVLAPFATLATDQVTLAAGASAEVVVTLAPIDFALPGELELWGIATARTDANVLARARATVQVPESSGIAARFEPATVVLNGPGTGASILAVENVGNMEDGFTATITAVNGVRTATMTGLRGEPTATVAGFRLPGLASGGILTNAELAAFGSGSVTVGIVSDTDPTVRAEATLNLVTANQPPIANAGGDRQASLGRAVSLAGGGSSDPDGQPGPLTYAWTLLAVPDGSALGAGAIQPADRVAASFTPDVAGTWRVGLTVSDGADTATTSVTLTVVDNLPIANAGADRNVLTNGAVTLDGSASFDPLGALLTWAWSLVAAPPGSLLTQADISGADGAAPAFVPDRDGEYRFTLVVTADGRESLPDEVRITAATANVPPNADAGPDQRVQVGDLVQLDGGASHDPDEGPSLLNYLWSFARVPGASAVTDADLSTPEAGATTFTPDAAGEYAVSLQVSDGTDRDEDQVSITAESANLPPVAEAGADQRVVPGTAVTLDGRASHDPDASGPLVFGWTFVSLPHDSALSDTDIDDADDPVAHFQPDVVGEYVLRLTVSDGIASAADNVLIDVVAPPTAVTDLYARAKPGRADLVWTAAPGAAGYEVWRRTDSAWGPRASLSATSTPVFADTGLTNAVNHCYRVRWRDGTGLWSAASNAVCVVPIGRPGR